MSCDTGVLSHELVEIELVEILNIECDRRRWRVIQSPSWHRPSWSHHTLLRLVYLSLRPHPTVSPLLPDFRCASWLTLKACFKCSLLNVHLLEVQQIHQWMPNQEIALNWLKSLFTFLFASFVCSATVTCCILCWSCVWLQLRIRNFKSFATQNLNKMIMIGYEINLGL